MRTWPNRSNQRSFSTREHCMKMFSSDYKSDALPTELRQQPNVFYHLGPSIESVFDQMVFLRCQAVHRLLPLQPWLFWIEAGRESRGTCVDGAKEVRVVHGSVLEIRSREIGEPQVGAREVRRSEMCSPQVSPIQDGQIQPRSIEMRSAEVSIGKIGRF